MGSHASAVGSVVVPRQSRRDHQWSSIMMFNMVVNIPVKLYSFRALFRFPRTINTSAHAGNGKMDALCLSITMDICQRILKLHYSGIWAYLSVYTMQFIACHFLYFQHVEIL